MLNTIIISLKYKVEKVLKIIWLFTKTHFYNFIVAILITRIF